MNTQRQRVAITGSSGLIGGALSSYLRERGDEVVHLVRRAPKAEHEVQWNPAEGELETTALAGVTAAVNLAGAGIGDKRWTEDYKRTLVSSRVNSTTTLVEALVSQPEPVRLVNGSAMGFYGDQGDAVLTESSPAGGGFLADLVKQWEGAARAAVDAGLPVAYARTSLVLGDGGMMGRVLPLAKAGLGGPLGSGKQWWSWITVEDQVRAIAHLIDHPEVTGPVNMATPNPIRQRDFMKLLGTLLGRPSILPAPKFALRTALGGLADDILGSQRLQPQTLSESGFTWRHPDLESGLRYVIDRT